MVIPFNDYSRENTGDCVATYGGEEMGACVGDGCPFGDLEVERDGEHDLLKYQQCRCIARFYSGGREPTANWAAP